MPKGQDTYDVTGNLTIRGNTKTVTLPVKVAGPIQDPWGNAKIGFETATTINRKDYGVSWSKAMDNGGLVVSDDVAITIALDATTALGVSAAEPSSRPIHIDTSVIADNASQAMSSLSSRTWRSRLTS